ncbi:hypothetical protein J6590_097713 [Homalodisca vitripennis]|nr:hypothetical protein J6590_097713 [Homalodisca vitripennis]
MERHWFWLYITTFTVLWGAYQLNKEPVATFHSKSFNNSIEITNSTTSNAVITKGSRASTSLQLVIAVARHGNRASDFSVAMPLCYPVNDTNTWPYGPGQLTNFSTLKTRHVPLSSSNSQFLLSCSRINTAASIDSPPKFKLESVMRFLYADGNSAVEIYRRIKPKMLTETHKNHRMASALTFLHRLILDIDKRPPLNFARIELAFLRLGKRIRSLYDGFISQYYLPEQVMAYTKDESRLVMSAELLLAGLFPPRGYQVWNSDLLWQPVPVFRNYKEHTRVRCFWWSVPSQRLAGVEQRHAVATRPSLPLLQGTQKGTCITGNERRATPSGSVPSQRLASVEQRHAVATRPSLPLLQGTHKGTCITGNERRATPSGSVPSQRLASVEQRHAVATRPSLPLLQGTHKAMKLLARVIGTLLVKCITGNERRATPSGSVPSQRLASVEQRHAVATRPSLPHLQGTHKGEVRPEKPSLTINLRTNGLIDSRTTTNGQTGGLLSRTGSLSSHPPKQQPPLRWRSRAIPVNASACPKFQRAQASSLEQYEENYDRNVTDLVEYVQRATGINIVNDVPRNFVDHNLYRIALWFIWESIIHADNEGLKLPKWAARIYPDPIAHLISELTKAYATASDIQIKLFQGEIFQEIISFMQHKVEQMKAPKRFYLYTFHDGTIFGLMHILGHSNYSVVQAKTGSALIFELHKDPQSGGHYVKVVFINGATQELGLSEVNIPGCDSPCDFHLLCNITEKYYNVDDWKKECEN